MPSIDPAISNLFSAALGLIFGASAAMKFRDLASFESSVANYLLLPASFQKPFAYFVPLAEAAAAAGVLIDPVRRISAIGLFLLMLMFTGAIAINLIRGRTNIDCGCFGPALRQELSGWLLIRNLFLMLVALTMTLPLTTRSMQPVDFVTVLFG